MSCLQMIDRGALENTVLRYENSIYSNVAARNYFHTGF